MRGRSVQKSRMALHRAGFKFVFSAWFSAAEGPTRHDLIGTLTGVGGRGVGASIPIIRTQ